MPPQSDLYDNLLPASGIKLDSVIDLALDRLRKWADAEGQKWDNFSQPHARLWRELLQQTKARQSGAPAPTLAKSQIAIPAAIELDGREWKSFLLWFEREMHEDLATKCAQEGLPPLVPVRRSNRAGGRPENSEALYHLAFEPKARKDTVPGPRGSKAPSTTPLPPPIAQPQQGPKVSGAPNQVPSGASAPPVPPGPAAPAQQLSTAAHIFQRAIAVDWILVGSATLGVMLAILWSLVAYGLTRQEPTVPDEMAAISVLMEAIRDLGRPPLVK